MLFYSTLLVVTFANIFGSCLEYPDDWKGSTWKDSFSTTDVTFTSTVMTGLVVNALGVNITKWTCFLTKNDMIVSRSQSTVSHIGVDNYVYLCQKYKRITDSVYGYYLMSKKNSLANNARVHLTDGTVNNVCDVCNNGDPKPSDSDYYVMRKDGGDVNVNITALYPACAVVGCNQCTSSCSDSDFKCVAESSSAIPLRYTPVFILFILKLYTILE